MESNWRYNVELVGLGGPVIPDHTVVGSTFMTVKYVAQLVTPFTLFGRTYTHVALGVGTDGVRRAIYLSLLGSWPPNGIFSWFPVAGHFPFGIPVLPD